MNGPMKKLLLAAMMMLAVPLAFAASPTASLMVQIVPTAVGNSCDVGPPFLGPIPPGAVAAGFTRCLYNLDLAQFFNLNTVINCKGASTPLMYAVSDGPNNCNDYNIVSDGGAQVLDLTFTPSDFASGTRDSKLSTTDYNLVTGYTFPSSHYVSYTYRMTDASKNAYNTNGFRLLGDIWEWSPNAISSSAFVEFDHDENATVGPGSCCNSGTGSGWWNQPAGGAHSGQQVLPLFQDLPGYDFTIYGTYGARIVSDGSTTIQYCTYLSGAGTSSNGNVGCTTINNSSTNFSSSDPDNYTQRHMEIVEVGPQGAYDSPTANEDLLLRSMTVFGCSNPGGTCNRSIPPP